MRQVCLDSTTDSVEEDIGQMGRRDGRGQESRITSRLSIQYAVIAAQKRRGRAAKSLHCAFWTPFKTSVGRATLFWLMCPS